jgi:hypothetical protein
LAQKAKLERQDLRAIPVQQVPVVPVVQKAIQVQQEQLVQKAILVQLVLKDLQELKVIPVQLVRKE